MYRFKDLLKRIREESNLTQEDLGKVIGVSTVLISMIETGQKEASKKFVEKLAEKLEVRPSSILPFVATKEFEEEPSGVEKILVEAAEKLQIHLISVKSKKLRSYVQS